jgi:hypothetical protein
METHEQGGSPLTPPRPRQRPHKPSRRELALLAYLERTTADPVAARLATLVVGMHAGLMAWIAAAEYACTLAQPALDAGVSQSREPDDRMLTLVEHRLEAEGVYDPERLEPTRAYLAHRLGVDAGWYVAQTGGVLLERWEPLAVRLGDYIGDQTAANALATSLLGHHHLAITALNRSRGVCHAARQRWSRMAERYVRTLDEQRGKGRHGPAGRVVVESVGEDDIRRFG